ncbi:N-acetylmuramic acid 6-phosphate etherase [Lactiplantibacillus pentosus]|jgi:N-acetylmuramic acid 6-phosphate etherase|uniref:N-acetylmuramic acid 6-phosphate etherase n=1 Tax=Lactiplantibacillus pentosus TaxID=1589 RepID=UPI00128C09EF|nr:N-acetylmuramic acid 6-phosphate etherase [Lactiplantibacillus pentosus]BBM21893.1 N-acetylmuramic acid 6-phosphate etherase [Lactiplantibacillus plantarum]MCA1343722.1 N-acetylmuramic acid 6-phosphate etherase [Lactiplantibacillus pentosus]MCJ8185780.1 N-acetylmuramic acid 6-phosphate etherase [Lactiplantibacillus pentosus]MCT3292047.1 N-acetylmuramic acid 6-phosphate etherase [Lactiplantibacillus pentosus]MPQ18915.1 N-acetylmuramic acid 6-phosphate etherase [Lactiplantibacillus pentosus]
MKADINQLTTESRNPASNHLDEMSVLAIAQLMNQEDAKVSQSITPQLPQIAAAIDLIVKGFKAGGRLIYMGAGTSGRLGVLDAAECVPTFGTDPSMVQGLIAGGAQAMTVAVEGAEDDFNLGGQDLKALKLTANDAVVGLAASGRTPYVIGALDYAHEIGAATISLACNASALISQHAQVAIEVTPGPEVLSGSTRLKAGTAEKMVLNMLSTISMVKIGKVYHNLMVDVKPTNEKLVIRAKHMIELATGVSADEASELFTAANQNVKTAIVMNLANVSVTEAEQRLQRAHGVVRDAL